MCIYFGDVQVVPARSTVPRLCSAGHSKAGS